MRSLAGCFAIVCAVAMASNAAAAPAPAPHAKHKAAGKAKPVHAAAHKRPAKRHVLADEPASDDHPASAAPSDVAVAIESPQSIEPPGLAPVDRDAVEIDPPAHAPIDRDAVEIDDSERVIIRHTHRASDWHVAIGPDAWVPAFVDARLPGGSSVSGNLGNAGGGRGGAFPVAPHVRFGLPLIGEARYHRFSLVVDLLYGAVGVNGGGEEGPVMVTLDGAASYLQLDSFLGYRLLGDTRSTFAVELRGGMRYHRAVVDASVGAAGNNVAALGLVDAQAEGLAGARAHLARAARSRDPSGELPDGGRVDLSERRRQE